MSGYCKSVLPELFQEENKCFLTNNSNIVEDFSRFDAVLLSHELTASVGPLMWLKYRNRSPKQRQVSIGWEKLQGLFVKNNFSWFFFRFVFVSFEASQTIPMDWDMAHFFNWTMSYRRGATVIIKFCCKAFRQLTCIHLSDFKFVWFYHGSSSHWGKVSKTPIQRFKVLAGNTAFVGICSMRIIFRVLRLPPDIRSLAQRKNLVLKIFSHCPTLSGREKYIQELRKHVKVYAFAICYFCDW